MNPNQDQSEMFKRGPGRPRKNPGDPVVKQKRPPGRPPIHAGTAEANATTVALDKHVMHTLQEVAKVRWTNRTMLINQILTEWCQQHGIAIIQKPAKAPVV